MMKSFAMQILMLLLLHQTTQLCNEGCLKCSPDNTCLFCDTKQRYILQDDSCLKDAIANCDIYSQDGECLQCMSSYYLDNVTNQCINIPDEVKINNCAFYQMEGACSVCEPQFYLSGLTCSPTTLTIDNCQVYSSIDKCQECSDGYIVQKDFKNCLKIEDKTNCQTYTSIKCDTCQDGYHLQKNMQQMRTQFLLKSSLAQKQIRALEIFHAKKIPTSDNCISVIPENCLQLEDFQTCQICAYGYFKKENKCIKNPEVAIANCKEYSSNTRCKECYNGYRLTPAPQYNCTAVENISHCQVFDGTQFITQCVQCKERFYLKSQNFCDQRTKSVEFCLNYEIDQDGCAQCETHYDLTSDKAKCLPETPGCQMYLESDLNSEKLICDQCKEYYYLNEKNRCTLGSIENCQIYERTFDQCKICENNFFLNSNLECELHTPIEGCKNYDPYIKNKCIDCEFDHFLLKLKTECQQVQVENCRVHKTVDHCAECDEGYSLLNNGQCEELQTNLNCLIGQYGLCIKCKDGYELNQGICKIQLIYEKDVCQLNEIPINYQSSLQCTSKDDLIKLGLSQSLYDNCKQFEIDEDSNFKCLECEDEYYINKLGGCEQTQPAELCVDNDDFFYRQLNFKFRKNKENLLYVTQDTCLRIAKNDQPQNTCKKYGIQKDKFNIDKDIQYGCLECIDDPSQKKYFQILDLHSDKSTLLKTSNNIFWKSKFECSLKDEGSGNYSSVVWGDAITNATHIDNCEYFYNIINDKLGCLKCKTGYNGVIQNPSIERCLKYDKLNLKCLECQENFLIDNDGKSCTYKDSSDTDPSYVENCQKESFDDNKCYQCIQGYTLTDNGQSCQEIDGFATIDNCAAYVHNSDSQLTTTTCEVCNDGFYLTDDKLNCWPYGDNCLKPSSASECETCEVNYKKDGSNECKPVNDCEYNETNSDTCIVKTNFEITSTNKCTLVTFSDCEKFNQEQGKCEQCIDGKYLFKDLKATPTDKIYTCVSNGQFPTDVVTLDPAHTPVNCKEIYVFDESKDFEEVDRYGCKTCKDGYHFKDSTKKKLSEYKCVQDNKVDKGNGETTDILITDNTFNLNCSKYDLFNEKCTSCKEIQGDLSQTYYLSNGHCCLIGKYYIYNSCEDIDNDQFPNCNKLDLIDNQQKYKCISCVATYTLLNDVCSLTSDGCDFLLHGDCIKKDNENCETYDIVQNYCKECKSNFYSTPSSRGTCCGNDQFYDLSDSSCKAIADDLIVTPSDKQVNLRAKCKRWDDKNKICLLCDTDYTFQGKICVKTDDVYKNCNLIDKKTNTCRECKDGFSMVEDYQICCNPSQWYYFNIQTGECTQFADNTSDNGNDGNNDKKVSNCTLYNSSFICEQCKDGYKLLEDKVCCPHNKMFYDPKTDQDNCIYPGEEYDYCLQYTFEEDSGNKTGNYSCNICNKNYSSEIDQADSKFCCPFGKKLNTTTKQCEEETSLNCHIFSSDQTQCIMCKLDKQIVNNECQELPDNCTVKAEDAEKCRICNLGHVSNNEGSAHTCSNEELDKLKGKYYCSSYNQTDTGNASTTTPDDCDQCLETLQINQSSNASCCLLGTYEQGPNNCQPIPIENCAIWDGTKCTQCVQDENKCTQNYDFTTMEPEPKDRYLLTIFTGDLRISINEKYYLGTDIKQNCCKFGYYYDGNSCVEIPVKQCKKFDVKNFKCIECINNYLLVGNFCKPLTQDQCSFKNTSDDTYYSSNNHCCPEGKYWNEDENLCEDIPDKKCKKSDDGIVCNECDTDHKPQTIIKSQYQLHYRITLNNCPHIHKHKSFYHCVSNSDYDDLQNKIYTHQVQELVENCAEVDYENFTCTKCKDNSYRPEGIPICCPVGQVAVKIENKYICRNLQTEIGSECLDFDGVTNTCTKCITCNDTDFTSKCSLSGGICCPRFQHFNIVTKTCENMKLGDCQDVDLETKMCRQCPKEYYFYYNACVKEGYKFKDFDFDEIEVNPNDSEGSNCLQNSPQGHCAVCDLKEGETTEYYNLLGQCLKQTFQKIPSEESSSLIIGSGLEKQDDSEESACKVIDQFGQCQQCIDGYILNNGRCCEKGRKWQGTSCEIITPDVTNCGKKDYTKDSVTCTTCSTGDLIQYIKPSNESDNEQKCLTNYSTIFNNDMLWEGSSLFVSDVKDNIAFARIQSLENCIIFSKGECQQCIPGYVLSITTFDYSTDQDGSEQIELKKCVEATPIDNCSIYNKNDPTKCVKCNGKFKLNTSNNKCKGDELDHCLLSDEDGCTQCKQGYLVRKKIDYSSNPQTSENLCWFNTIPACNKLEDGTTQCAECDDGFILNYKKDQCIQDSSITEPDCIRFKITSFTDNNTKECQRCDRGHFYNTSSCADVNNPITNCRVYSADDECSECENGYYLQQNNLCIPDDQIYYNEIFVSWKKFNIENCANIDFQISSSDKLENIQCKTCKDGFNLSNGLCCPDGTIGIGNRCYQFDKKFDQNCQEFKNDGTCRVCKTDYQLVDNVCRQCITGYNIVTDNDGNKRCCSVESIESNQTLNTDYYCYDFRDKIYDNCKEFDINDNCTKCHAGDYLINGKCCSENQINNDEDCYKDNQIFAQDCKIFNNSGQCKECKADNYEVYGGCCSLDQYYNPILKQCLDITNEKYVAKSSSGIECQKLNEDYQCKECNDENRLYNGTCYDDDEKILQNSFDQDNSITDPYPQCKVVQDLKCTQCTIDSPYEIGELQNSNKCCGKSDELYYYDEITQSCKQMLSQCKNFDHDTNICLECNESYYSTGTHCCGNDKYYDQVNKVCANISSLSQTFKSNCAKITEKDFELKKCTECQTSYYLINGFCYPKSTIVDNCDKKNNKYCLQCKSTYSITGIEQSICCPNNYILDSTTLQCTSNTTINNCVNRLSNDICQQCDTDYYLAKEDTCCENGKKLIEDACSSDVSIKHCQEWKTITNGEVCSKCADGYYPQDYIKNGLFTSKCCSEGQFLEPLTEQCINMEYFTEDKGCERFDIYLFVPYYRSPQCLDEPGENKYITSIYQCDDLQFFDEETQKCETFSQTDYPDCKQVFNDKCLECKDDFILYEDKCCPKKQYLNDSNQCVASTSNGLQDDCEEFYHECPPDQMIVDCQTFQKGNYCKTCDSDNSDLYLTYNYKCCEEYEYYDEQNNECKTYNKENVGIKYRANLEGECKQFGKGLKCLECNSKTLTDDQMNCCEAADQFIDHNNEMNCVEKFQVPSECKIYDHEKYLCKECMNTSYLTEGICCTFGNYYKRETKLCTPITAGILEKYANCNQYDEKKKCLGCQNGYELNSDQQCIEVPTNCEDFDATILKCRKCKDSFLLSDNGNCCSAEELDSYGVCKNIQAQVDIQDCNLYSHGRCLDCKDDHYFIQSACCSNESYLRDGVCCKQGTYLIEGICCEYGTYKTNGVCCPKGQVYDPNSSDQSPCRVDSSADADLVVEEETKQKELDTIENCKEYGYKQNECNVCKDGYILVKSLWNTRCIKMQTGQSGSEQPILANCVQYQGFYDDDKEKVKCIQCKVGNQETDENQPEKFYKLELEEITDNNIILELKDKIEQDNCQVYHIISQFEISSFLCIKCTDNYYLNKQNLCIARSQNNIDQCNTILPLDKDECMSCKDGYYSNYQNICETIPIEHCIKYDKERDLCLKCDESNNNDNISGYNQESGPANKEYKFMVLQYYQVNDGIKSKCVLKKHTQIGYPNHYKGYINQCVSDSEQEEIKAINLDSFYDKWYSFNYCNDTSKIPIVLVKAGRDQTGMPYALGHYLTNDISSLTIDQDDIDEYVNDESNEFNDQTNFGSSTKCIANYQELFTGQDINVQESPVENCALLMTNVEMQFEVNESKEVNPDFSFLSTFCTACKTNYKPVFNGLLPIIVTQCQQIPNCQTNSSNTPKILNGCSECSKDTSDTTKNYTFKVDQNGQVDYTQCVQTHDTKCKLLNQDGTCKYCEEGYMPNYDGVCEVLSQHNCEDEKFSFQNGFTVDNFEYVISYLGLHKGCQQCIDGYKGLLVDTQKLVCTKSSTLLDSSINNNSKIYDSNCSLYGIQNGKASCVECIPDYLLDINNKCIQTQLEHCKIVLNVTQCNECKDDYVLKDGKCQIEVIENCKEHSQDNLGNTICTNCNDGFYLQNQLCKTGSIENCKIYNDIPRCIVCEDNYVLVTLKDGQQQCSAISEQIHPNCIQYKSQAFNSNRIECQQCSTLKFLPIYHEIEQDICLQLDTIDNCIKYDKDPLFIHSSLKCLECEDKYVLNNQVCEERKLNILNCKEYSKFEQKCEECNESFYLASNGEECIQKPIGIPNCDIYIEYDQCKHCINHTYLLNNVCLNVDQQIQHCKYYKNSTECILCNNGFVLENNQCKEYKVSCKTYLNSNECITCPSDQGIIYQDGKRICSNFNVIQYCDQHSQIEPYECKKCINGYFLYEELPRNKCVKVINEVDNCEIYYGPEDCSKCVEGYTLSLDQRKCLEINFNDKCASRIEQQPYCVKCQQGYVFSNEQQCVEENNKIAEGCLGLDQNGECELCYSGYYQNSNKECIKI